MDERGVGRGARTMQNLPAFYVLRRLGAMRCLDAECGWDAVPQDVVAALVSEGFVEYRQATTTSRRDARPSGGVWRGVNPLTGTVAEAVWVNDSLSSRAVMSLTIDGDALIEAGADAALSDLYRDDGGEA